LTILGEFAKLRKATISFVMSVRPSVRPHETTLLPLDGFWWNLVFEYFSKNLPRKFKFYSNMTRITDALHEDQYTFFIISRSLLPRMKNFSDKCYRENRNTRLMINKSFFLIVLFMRSCGSALCSTIRWATVALRRMRIACSIPKATNTLSEYLLLLFHCNSGSTNVPQW
jgi:hypothetical protein